MRAPDLSREGELWAVIRDPTVPLEDRLTTFTEMLVGEANGTRREDGRTPTHANGLAAYAAAAAEYWVQRAEPAYRPGVFDAEAIADDALFLLFKKAPTVETGPRPWLWGTIRNLTRRALDANKHHLATDKLSDNVPLVSAESDDPSCEAEEAIRFDAILAAIGSLQHPRDRQVCQLHLMDRLPLVEVAKMLQITPNAARQAWFRAKRKLMERLAPYRGGRQKWLSGEARGWRPRRMG